MTVRPGPITVSVNRRRRERLTADGVLSAGCARGACASGRDAARRGTGGRAVAPAADCGDEKRNRRPGPRGVVVGQVRPHGADRTRGTGRRWLPAGSGDHQGRRGHGRDRRGGQPVRSASRAPSRPGSGRPGRAARLAPAGETSANGTCRLLRADSWLAVSLSRPVDIASLPAVLGRELTADPWAELSEHAAAGPAASLAALAQLVGIPAAALGSDLPRTAWLGGVTVG